MLNSRKYNYFKFICLIILILSLLFLYMFSKRNNPRETYIKNDVQNKIENLKSNRTENSKIVSNVKFNKEDTYYNDKENTYYYYLDTMYQGTYKYLYTTILSDFNFNYIVNSNNYKKRSIYYIDFSDTFEIFVYSNEYYYTFNISFTNLPIINIETDDEIIDKKYVNANFTLYDNDNNLITSETYIKIRGASSKLYIKKCFRLSLHDGEDKNKISLLGMRTDEDWILDALYSDPSRIRSKLANDLWNQVSSNRSYYENNNDSEFVEVYLNNEYNGLYVLKEPVDRKQLNLNKKTDVDSGIMIKGYNHGSYNFDNYTIKNILKPFEMKYPQNIEDYSSYWEILNNKMKNYYYNNDNSDKVLKETFNIDNLIDYRIFLNATYAADNYDSKNTIISMKSIKDDSKLIFTPWDLDETFGRVYDEEISEIHVKTVHNEYEDYTGVLFEDGAAEYNSKLKERYLELRKNVLSIDNINSLIDEYYNLLSINAYFKENKRWNKEYDIDEEITFIKEWVSNRLDYLDKLIGDYDV